VINALAGKRAGYGEAYAQLQRDPCVQYPTVKESPTTKGERPFAYRLSGPLESKVCGVRLKRGYRLAFTMGASTGVEVPGMHRGAVRRQADHLRPPCCESGLPNIDEQDLTDFMAALRKLLRG
jgi:hypothetical protein